MNLVSRQLVSSAYVHTGKMPSGEVKIGAAVVAGVVTVFLYKLKVSVPQGPAFCEVVPSATV